MNKLILKTACVTLATLVLAGLLVFSVWILCAPQTMASSCEKTGNYSFAVTCADLRYSYTKDIGDLARCAEDGILSGKDKHILNYCGKLVAEKGIDELCIQKDKQLSESAYGKYTVSYKSYIFGHLSAAQYRSGELDKAIATAKSGDSFTRLVLSVIENGTKTEAGKVLDALGNSNEKLAQQLNDFINKGD